MPCLSASSTADFFSLFPSSALRGCVTFTFLDNSILSLCGFGCEKLRASSKASLRKQVPPRVQSFLGPALSSFRAEPTSAQPIHHFLAPNRRHCSVFYFLVTSL